MEFAEGSRPDSAASVPSRHAAMATDLTSGLQHFVMTLAVRAGTDFSGSGPLTGTKDGIVYHVEGSGDLTDFNLQVEAVSPVVLGSLPLVMSGYEYRTFRLIEPVANRAQGFLRSAVLPAP
jgi:hypothetical protein